MNKANVMQIAKESGFERLGHTDDDWVCCQEDIERFAEMIARAERKEWQDEFAGMGEWSCVNIMQERYS